MTETWLELLGVTARLYPSGTPIDREMIEVLDDRRYWYCSAGNSLKDSNVAEQGVLQDDITVFEFSYPAVCSYRDELWGDFTFLEYGDSDVIEYALEELAIIARALLNRQTGKRPVYAVRFLTAWEATTTPGGYFLDGWEPPETDAYLIGWANIALDGLTIVSIEELIKEVLQ